MYCQNCGNKLKSGIKICSKCGYINTYNRTKTYKTLIVSVLILSLTSLFIYIYQDKSLKTNIPYELGLSNVSYCNFEIYDVKEYNFGKDYKQIERKNKDLDILKNDYSGYKPTSKYEEIITTGMLADEAKNFRINRAQNEIYELENNRNIYYEGFIKNNSRYPQRLISINTRLSTESGIFLAEGGSIEYNLELSPGDSIPFKTTVKVKDKDLVKNYIDNKNIKLNYKFYPWFESCIY